ncbi:prickle-like protein 4 isoform X1 [Moschus berezovskii]|uniref:prickle-like protein 4 isoform X1 n=2 Tax=Moschus berezovskii TaxID=68408 RepID=UPI002444226B|nr:prickle-like protein 4 isoform X1 [Moschus berezovskii]
MVKQMGGLLLFSVQTLPPMSLLNSGWPHRRKRLASPELNLPVNSDSDPDHTPKKDPEETSAQDPEVPSWGHPGLDTTPAPSWPGLRSLVQQLPPQDSDSHFNLACWGSPSYSGCLFLQERYCLALGEEELAELRLFCAQRRREALGQGVARLAPLKLEECTCDNCRERLRPGEYGVFAARAGKRRCWHQACFACQACGQALINLIYFYHDGRLYCGRHHAELLRPRCPACDQLIFSRRCTEAEGRRWHENHFCCQDCAGPLGGGRYALPGGGPCCPSCFERRYSDAGSSPARTLESRASPGEEGLCRVGDPDCAQPNAATISRATFLATAASSSLETRSGMLGSSAEQEYRAGDQTEARQRHAQGRLETPLDPKEDAPCPTCSSSSESEPEGFFLGQRLPRPWETPALLRTGDSDTSRRHCTIC